VASGAGNSKMEVAGIMPVRGPGGMGPTFQCQWGGEIQLHARRI
jgi:hypothetical protein